MRKSTERPLRGAGASPLAAPAVLVAGSSRDEVGSGAPASCVASWGVGGSGGHIRLIRRGLHRRSNPHEEVCACHFFRNENANSLQTREKLSHPGSSKKLFTTRRCVSFVSLANSTLNFERPDLVQEMGPLYTQGEGKVDASRPFGKRAKL